MRWLWYILIGICFAVAVIIWALYFPGGINQKHYKWVQLAVLTAIIFGYLLQWGWHYRRKAKFWRLYFIFFLGHCVIFVFVFSFGRWPSPVLAVVGSIEIMGLATLIALAMNEK
ncbi:MAG: hypothetical protein ACRD4F_02665, partial [Candidatus Angelobacter sp.]